MNERENRLTPQEIIEINAKRFGVTPEQLMSRGGPVPVRRARNKAYRQMRDEGMSFIAIGRIVGRDHSTIVSGVRRDISTGEEINFIPPTEIESKAQEFLEENFPGISLENVQQDNRVSRINVPRQALNRYLFYDEGVGIAQITELLKRNHSTVIKSINKPEDRINAEIEDWQRKEDQRIKKEKVQKAKKATSEKIKQEIDDRERRNQIFAQVTFNVVAEHYSVDLQDIISKGRLKIFAQPRKTAQFLLFKGTDFNYRQIASLVGRSDDHSTVIYSIKTVERRMEIDPEFRERVKKMLETINRLADEAMQAEKNSEESVIYYN